MRRTALLLTAVAVLATAGCSSPSPEAQRCQQAQQAFADFTHKAGSMPPAVPGSPQQAMADEKQRENFEANGRLAANVVLANQTCFQPKTVAIVKTWLDSQNQ